MCAAPARTTEPRIVVSDVQQAVVSGVRQALHEGSTDAPAPSETANALAIADPDAADQARGMLARARASRNWGEAEMREFRGLLTNLNAATRDEVLHELLADMNEGRIPPRRGKMF